MIKLAAFFTPWLLGFTLHAQAIEYSGDLNAVPVFKPTDKEHLLNHDWLYYDPIFHKYGNLGVQPYTLEDLSNFNQGASNVPTYTRKSHPNLPWDALENEALTRAKQRDPYTTVFVQNGAEMLKFKADPDAPEVVSHPAWCWFVAMPDGFREYTPLFVPPSCATKWQHIEAIQVRWVLPTDYGFDWTKYVRLYIYVFDADNKLLGGFDVTDSGGYAKNPGFPVNSRFMLRVVAIGPEDNKKVPPVINANIEIYGFK